MKEEDEKQYYLAMQINRNYQQWWGLVWCGKEYGWLGVEEAHKCMFRIVPLFTNKEAYKLKEEMESTGFFYPQLFSRKVLQISVEDYWRRNTFIFCGWDEEEGCTEPIAAIRCDGWYKARDYFERYYKDQFKYDQGQVKHISDCRYRWANEIKKLDLERDLFAQGLFAKEEEEEV